MEKKTIGQFIAALRKANGLTQQEVADSLNVSNKAVSRWERDECAPDISVIPALAELLGVTCDELLKGERILYEAQAPKSEPKVEKQVKALINRTLSGFKTLIWISLAVAVVGLVCMFGISYGIYRPVIGFALMMFFEACAFAIAGLAVSRTKDVKTDNELYESADEHLKKRYNHCLGTYSFWAFFSIVAVVLLSLPLVIFRSDYYVESVLEIESYLVLALGIALVLALVALKAKESFAAWITGEVQEERKSCNSAFRKMNFLQIGAVILAAVIFIICPYFDTNREETSIIFTILTIVGLLCAAANIIVFVVSAIREKESKKALCIRGIRNMLYILFALLCARVHSYGWSHYVGESDWERYDSWDVEYFWLGIGWVLLVTVVFEIIERHMQKR